MLHSEAASLKIPVREEERKVGTFQPGVPRNYKNDRRQKGAWPPACMQGSHNNVNTSLQWIIKRKY